MTERTLAIIKPDAVKAGTAGQILARIEKAGFKVLALKMIRMSEDAAAGFYAVHSARPFFKSLCTFMTQGPCIPMVLEADDARFGGAIVKGTTVAEETGEEAEPEHQRGERSKQHTAQHLATLELAA